MKRIFCALCFSLFVISCLATNDDGGRCVASINFTHFGPMPAYSAVIQVHDADARVYLFESLDSLYGPGEILERYQIKLLKLIDEIYYGQIVGDYYFHKKSEWAVATTRDIMTITLANGKEYRYVLGDTNSREIQLVDSHLVQYSAAFRQLMDLVYTIYNQMIDYYVHDSRYLANQE